MSLKRIDESVENIPGKELCEFVGKYEKSGYKQ